MKNFKCFSSFTIQVHEVVLLRPHPPPDDQRVRAGEVRDRPRVQGALGHRPGRVVPGVEGDEAAAGELGLHREGLGRGGGRRPPPVVPALWVEGGGAADEQAGAALQGGEHAQVVLAVGLWKKIKRDTHF